MTEQTEKTPEQLEQEAFASVFSIPEDSPAQVDEPVVAEETPAVEAKTEGEDATTEKEEEPPVVDEFAGLNPRVRELLAEIPGLKAQLALAQKVPELVGRVASLQSRLDKQSARIKEMPAAQFDAIKEDQPEVAQLLQQMREQMAPEPEPEPTPQPTYQSPPEDVLNTIRPTWAHDVAGADFRLWTATQPPAYQAQLRSTENPADILAALQRFDAYQTAIKQAASINSQRAERMRAAVLPSGNARPAPVVHPSQLSEAEQEAMGYAAAFGKT